MINLLYSHIKWLLLFLVLNVSAYQYGEQPLRSALSDKPQFQTSLGRDTHRFEGHNTNKFRLYDFYQRQAQYWLSNQGNSKLLLPFPGLDGGRRGHWGYTNEKSSTALERDKLPEFEVLTCRGDVRKQPGLQFIRFGKSENLTVVVYDSIKCSIKEILTQAEMVAPPSRFGSKVDRYGFFLRTKGNKWLTPPAIFPKGSFFQGYYIHGNKTVHKIRSNNVSVLNHINFQNEQLEQTLQFCDEFDSLSLTLLSNGEDYKLAKSQSENVIDISSNVDHQSIQLKVILEGIAEVNFKDGRLFLNKGEKNLIVKIIISKKPIHKTELVSPKSLISGGPQRFPLKIDLVGKVNADPAASGTAYEIDDIPIPFNNPYNIPMTLSGIDFDSKGNAYVSTLIGDVWKVSGIDSDLNKVTWKRFATGIHLPAGLKVVEDIPHVISKDRIVKLNDLNEDDEADFYASFNRVPIPSHGDKMGLQTDKEGNFFFCANHGIYKVSKDGKNVSKIGEGSRNPLGLGVRQNGLVLSDSSEGNRQNGTCSIYEANHKENLHSKAKRKRILYLPRGIDNSPGSRIFLNDPRFGPLGQNIVGVSYGRGSFYSILRDENEGTPQAALITLPGEFSSGAARLVKNPKDGQVYVVGFDGWGDYAVQEGCFHRVRYSGRKRLIPIKWQAHANGFLLEFNESIEASQIKPKDIFIQQWNYVDSDSTYGSNEYSVKNPSKIGHDRLLPSKIFQIDSKTVLVEIPEVLPAMSTQIYFNSSDAKFNMIATINKLRPAHGVGTNMIAKITDLVVPFKGKNSNTHQLMIERFDEAAGRKGFKREVIPAVPYSAKDLNYTWINKNIIQKQCFPRHMKGTPHDMSTYELLIKKANLKTPIKSHIYGMLSTNSMPPYPLPTVDKKMQKALLEWLKKGAPK